MSSKGNPSSGLVTRQQLHRKRRGGDTRCADCFAARVPPKLAREVCAECAARAEVRKSSAGAKRSGNRAGNPAEPSSRAVIDAMATVAASPRRSDPPSPP